MKEIDGKQVKKLESLPGTTYCAIFSTFTECIVKFKNRLVVQLFFKSGDG